MRRVVVVLVELRGSSNHQVSRYLICEVASKMVVPEKLLKKKLQKREEKRRAKKQAQKLERQKKESPESNTEEIEEGVGQEPSRKRKQGDEDGHESNNDGEDVEEAATGGKKKKKMTKTENKPVEQQRKFTYKCIQCLFCVYT